MSGIVFLTQQKKFKYCKKLLNYLTHYLSYRGPNGTDSWHEMQNYKYVGLGQAQLYSTFSSYSEKCPFHFENRFHIVSDSRVDGKEELISLLKSDFPFLNLKTPDSELILFSYVKWKERCVEYIIGDFAFFIWDSQKQKLFAARNHTGSIPLYYSRLNDGIILSNTLNCIKKHPEITLELNYKAIGDFLLFRQNWDMETTSFKNIYRIPPGSYLVWQDEMITIKNFWEPPETDEQYKSLKKHDYYEEFLEIFTKAVSDRLIAPKMDILLSGGMDSSSVAAIASELIKKNNSSINLNAINVSLKSLLDDNEWYFAKKLSKHLNISYTQLGDTENHIRDSYIDKLNLPEPSLWCTHLSLNVLIDYLLMKKNLSILLTGFGADAFFIKNKNHYLWKLKQGKIFSILRDSVFDKKLSGRFPGYISKTQIKRLITRKRNEKVLPEWINKDFIREYKLNERLQSVNHDRTNSNKKILIEFWSTLQYTGDPDQLMIPVKFLHPFLDVRLIHFFSKLPYYPYCNEKNIMRKALEPLLPAEITKRPKTLLQSYSINKLIERSNDSKWLSNIFSEKSNNYFVNNMKIVEKIKNNPFSKSEMHPIIVAGGLVNWLYSNKFN